MATSDMKLIHETFDGAAKTQCPWTRVDDRLPEIPPGTRHVEVIAFWATTDEDYDPGGIEKSWYDGRHWQGGNGDMDYHGARHVTHWMALPPKPLN